MITCDNCGAVCDGNSNEVKRFRKRHPGKCTARDKRMIEAKRNAQGTRCLDASIRLVCRLSETCLFETEGDSFSLLRAEALEHARREHGWTLADNSSLRLEHLRGVFEMKEERR